MQRIIRGDELFQSFNEDNYQYQPWKQLEIKDFEATNFRIQKKQKRNFRYSLPNNYQIKDKLSKNSCKVQPNQLIFKKIQISENTSKKNSLYTKKGHMQNRIEFNEKLSKYKRYLSRKIKVIPLVCLFEKKKYLNQSKMRFQQLKIETLIKIPAEEKQKKLFKTKTTRSLKKCRMAEF